MRSILTWGDVAAGLRAAPRVLLAGGYWGDVLRRSLFSRVFVGYVGVLAALVALALLATWDWLTGLGGIGVGAQLLGTLAAFGAGAFLLPLLLLLLLPYGYWVLLPPAAQRLFAELRVEPSAPGEEETFGGFLGWTGSVLGAGLLSMATGLLPDGPVAAAVQLAVLALLFASVMNLFVRAALARGFSAEQRESFLRATRWSRQLLWLPGLFAAGLLTIVLTGAAATLLATLGLRSQLPLVLLQLVLATCVGVAFTGALLRACARFHGGADRQPHGDPGPPTLLLPESEEQTRDRARLAIRRRRGWRRMLGAGIAGGVLLGAAAALYAAREARLDWYYGRDALYRDAPQAVQADRQPGFDAGLRAHRLRAGYIAYGCNGRLDRAAQIHALGVTKPSDHGQLLACAACLRQKAGVDWVLQMAPDVPLNAVVAASGGARTALQCAARDNDVALAGKLVQRDAHLTDPDGPARALEIAAQSLHLEIARLLLPLPYGSSTSATVLALESAYAISPGKALELLPRMLEAGLPLVARDGQGRNPFHLAAMRHDLALAQAMHQQPGGRAGPHMEDAQGVFPWVYVLRRGELDGQPLSRDALDLLRLLLPEERRYLDEIDHLVRSRSPRPFPPGWTPTVVLLNDPGARAVLGPNVEFGHLPPEPAFWWPFRGRTEAEEFVRGVTLDQLFNAENPYVTSDGKHPTRLSDALQQRGWPDLAAEVHVALRGIRTRAEAAAAAKRAGR